MNIPSNGNTYHIGYHGFSLSFSLEEADTAFFKLHWQRKNGKQNGVQGRQRIADALSSLTSNWQNIAGVRGGDPNGSSDIGKIITGGNDNVVRLVWTGESARIVTKDETIIFGGDSVIPVEILASLGDFISQIAPSDLQTAWTKARSSTDLPPFEIIDQGWESVGASQLEVAAWYANKLGIPPEIFVNGAIHLHADHIRWATQQDGLEATLERQNPYTWTQSDPAAAHAEAKVAAERLAYPVDDFIADAISSACTSARAVIIFGAQGWEREEASATPSL